MEDPWQRFNDRPWKWIDIEEVLSTHKWDNWMSNAWIKEYGGIDEFKEAPAFEFSCLGGGEY